MINFLSQLCKFLRVAQKVEKEGREDRLRGIGSSNDDKVTIVEDNVEWYFFFICTEFVGLRRDVIGSEPQLITEQANY